MRGFSSLASSPRLSSALRNPPEAALKQRNFQHQSLPKEGRTSLKGEPSLSHPNKSKVDCTKVDHVYVSQVLSRADWVLLLKHELNAKRIVLNSHSVISIFQNLENPLHSIKFYAWVSNIYPALAENQSVRGVLSNSLYRKGPVILSVELIQDIQKSGFQITEDLLCLLIGSWGRLGLAKYCSDIFGQISYLGLNPSTRLYNALIDALVKSNSIDLAYLKFQQMTADNCHPDRITYNILIHGVCKTGVVDEALRLMRQMEDRGHFPNVYSYTILIDGFCNAKRVDEAFHVLKTMKDKKVYPNEATIRTLIHGTFRCLDPRDVARAMKLLRRMQEEGSRPDAFSYNALIQSFCRMNKVEKAKKVLVSMSMSGVKPDNYTYGAFIEALFESGRFDEAKKIFYSMGENGCSPDSYICNLVVKELVEQNCFEEAQIIAERCKQNGISLDSVPIS
ncbi:hypothetical protein K1719_042340 [Acacia pycnantha]|nr:hypothetical protein K1719_042340 [Acacia pycnantha]